MDKTLSVVPLKKIRKVIKGDNTSKGSVVEIFYAGVPLKAEIIAVDGKWIIKFVFHRDILIVNSVLFDNSRAFSEQYYMYMNFLFLDDERKLDQLSFAFLADPNNAHLFPRNFSDEEELEAPQAPPPEKTDKSVKYFLLTLRLY